MRKLYLLAVGVLLFTCPRIYSQISLTTLNSAYSQDFNTLVTSGKSIVTPAGWLFTESGSNANDSLNAGTGSSGTGDTYSFGAGTNAERALGGLRSNALGPTVGAWFTNNTGSTVVTLQIAYTGEEWRLGVTGGRKDTLNFQYSLHATSLTTGTWTDVNAGDFTTPFTTTAGAVVGNNSGNRTTISFAITGLSIADGASFYIRWTDSDITGAEDGLAVDDFSITPGLTVTNNVFVSAGSNAAEPSTNGSFTVSLTAASASATTVNYDFTGSTATQGSDFTDAGSGALVIPAGQLSGTITITVVDDATVESSETITLNLTGVTSPYTISVPSGSISVTSDDIAKISFTGSYSQDFNTLVSTSTGDITTVPTGWLFYETGANAYETYAASDGTASGNFSGNTYSFGSTGSSDRAFGETRSGSLVPIIGAFFINNTGATVTSLTITYTGEQWRQGAINRQDKMDFQYSADATSLSTGTWADVNGLDFLAPNDGNTVSAFDGNLSANRVTYTYTLNGLSIPNGSTFAIRWTDYDVTGAEDGLGVDDFTITLGCTPPTNQPTALVLTPSLQSIDGSFTAAASGITDADNYLVLISTSASLTDMPASGTAYAIDDVIGNAKVVSINGTTFTASGLTPSTTWYFFVFSTGGTTCYNTISPLTDNVATTSPPACTPPTTQTTNLAAANITGTSMDLSWDRGNGNNVLVIAHSGAAVDAVIYNSLAYAQGATIGTGNTVIYNGPASSFAFTGLSQNTTYYFALYEYNSADNCYLTPALTGNFTTLCTDPQNVSSLNGAAGNGQAAISWTLPGSACFDEIIVVASTSSITNPGSTYTSPADPVYTTVEQVVYRGTGTTVTVTGLANGTTYYFKVFTRKGSNYSTGVQTTVIPYDPTSGYTYMYGNLHAHSSYSDGNKGDLTKTPVDDFAFARDALCMDFLGISEHNHSGAGMSYPDYLTGYNQANSLNGVVSGGNSIITLWGMEWGTISGGGHVLVYGFDDKLLGWESGNYDIYVEKSNYASLWSTVNSQSGAFATLAHPNTSDYTNLATAYNATADAAIVGQAVESGPAFSESTTYNDFPSSLGYLSYYRTMLSKGYKLAPQMDQDNHYMTFGTANSNRMVVLSSSPSREGLMEAIRSMRYYASQDCNIRVDFNNGSSNPMGSQVTNAGVPSLSMSITDPDGESVTSIELWGAEVGGSVPSSALKTVSSTSNIGTFSFIVGDANNNQPNNSTWYYYAVITQEDGNKVVTAPIWYSRNDAALPVTLTRFTGSYDRTANKVYLTWTTAQEFNSKEFVVERSTDGGRTYTTIAKVAAAGNTNHATTYALTDAQPAYGTNYYRLKQVDFDDKSELSGIVKIVTDNAGGFTAGPNPARSTVNVYRLNNTEPVRIEMMDINGRLLKQLTMPGTASKTTINVAGLMKGIYLLKLTTSKGIQTEKIMVE